MQVTKQEKESSHFHLCHSQKGMTLFAPLIILLTFSLGTLFIHKSLKENALVKERSYALLCLKEYEFSKRKYIKQMSRLNFIISSSFALRFIPPIGPYAQKVQEVAKKVQQIYHISHLKNSFTFNFCPSLIRFTYLKTLPYKTVGKITLTRRIDGTVPLKKEKWSELIWSRNKNIVFNLTFHLNGRFSSKPKIKRKEFSKEALQSWKASYGQAFSFL